jgi:hypothetical protein
MKSEIEKSINLHKSPQIKGLYWTDNSCYLDSTLFALFAGTKSFLDDLFRDLDIYSKKKPDDMPGLCGKSLEKDWENRKKVQKELKNVYNYIIGKESNSNNCKHLRMMFVNCKNKENYHTSNTSDPGEFVKYLLTILSSLSKANNTVISYKQTNQDSIIRKSKLKEIDKHNNTNASIVYSIFFKTLLAFHKVKNVTIQVLLDNNFQEVSKKKRIVKIEKVQYSPYLIIDVWRGGYVEENDEPILLFYSIYPNELIVLSDKKSLFTLCAIVIYSGDNHYVSIAKYGDFWYYYDDNSSKKSENGKQYTLQLYSTFNDIMDDVNKYPETMFNPLTHGTQYYYKPV